MTDPAQSGRTMDAGGGQRTQAGDRINVRLPQTPPDLGFDMAPRVSSISIYFSFLACECHVYIPSTAQFFPFVL